MSNLTNLEFVALDISGKNYLSWVLDAEIHLDAKGLGETIVIGKETSNQTKARAMIFLRHHLHEGLKSEYLTVKDPLELWTNLKERFDHQKMVILPKARYDWIHLRLQDFKTVTEYNSAVFEISSRLKLCGEKITEEDLLEKTFSTFHASNVLLQQQYREKGFKKYSELISCLLVAELNNELLMKNHEIRPTGSAPFPEANAAMHNKFENGKSYYRVRGRGRGRGHGRGRGRGRNHYNGRNNNVSGFHKKNDDKGKTQGGSNNTLKGTENTCYRCGMKGHWSRTCRTADHLVKLYKESIQQKGKNVEANMISQDDGNDNNEANFANNFPFNNEFTHLDVGDFLEDHDGMNGDESTFLFA